MVYLLNSSNIHMHEKLPNLTITWMHKWSNYRWRSDNHEYFCTCIYITEFSKNLGMENCCRYHNFLCLQTQSLLFLEIATNSLSSLTFLAISCVSLAVPVSSVSLLSNSSAVIDCWSSSSYWLISFSHASSWFSTSSVQSSEDESFATDRFSLLKSSVESEYVGLFSGILFAPLCLSLSLGRDVPDVLAWSLSR